MILHARTTQLLTCLASVAMLVGILASPAAASTPDLPVTSATDDVEPDADSLPGRVVITWDSDAPASTRREVRRSLGLRSEETFEAIDVEVVGVPVHAADRIVSALSSESSVVLAEPDFVMAPDSNDAGYGVLWGLHNTGQSGGTADMDIDAPEAWQVTRGASEVIVAVVDSGVDISHPDLAGNIWVNPGEIPDNGIDDDGNGYVDDVNGWDFHANDNTVYDSASEDRHGTHVAGTIAATADNIIGVAGVAPNVTVMPLKFMGGADGIGSSSAAAAAISYAHANGATVVNASWGGGGGTTLQNAIKRATGTVVVAAAGNAGEDIDGTKSSFPALWADDRYSMPNVLSVASIDRDGARSSFSNHGSASVDLGAPGRSIYSTIPTGSYGSMSGTSMAAPHASGVAALVASVDRTLGGAALTSAVKAGAVPLRSLSGVTTTGGLLNAANAVRDLARPDRPTGVSATAGDSAATVSWTPATGGGKATSYLVSVSPTTGVTGSTTRSVAAPTTSVSFDGLTNGTAYRFTVTATNGVGASSPSDPSIAVTPGGSPTDGDGDGTDDGSDDDTGDGGGDASLRYDGTGARSLDRACPGITESGFRDVATGTTHAPGVGCAAAWRTIAGAGDGSFLPNHDLTRGQLASVLARAVEEARGEALPAGRDHFVDDNDSVHRSAIDKLAAQGIVAGVDATRFGPSASVTRGQFAAMLARTYRHLVGELPAGSNAFVDDDGTTHEKAINGLAALGIVAGTGSREYRPGADLSRAQAATLVARLLDALVEAGAARSSGDSAPPS